MVMESRNNSKSMLCASKGSHPYVAPCTLKKAEKASHWKSWKDTLFADSFTVRWPVVSGSPISSMSMSRFFPWPCPLSGEGVGVRVGEPVTDPLLLLLRMLWLEAARDRGGEVDGDGVRLSWGVDFRDTPLPLSLVKPSDNLRPVICSANEPSSRRGIFIARVAAETTLRLSARVASLADSRSLIQTRRASFFSASSG